MKRVLLGGGLVFGLLLAGVPARAQGTARGVVVDEKGQPVEGASVVIEFQGGVTRKVDLTTSKKGEYTRVGLQPGNYKITVTKEGYGGQSVEIRVQFGDPTQVPNIKLAPAAKAAAEAGGQALQAIFARGMKASQAGQFDEAEAAFKEVLDKNPSRPEVVWNSLGFMYSRKKDGPAAEDAFRKAIDAKPDFPEAYEGLASHFISTGQAPKAVELVQKAAAEYPDNPKFQFAYGWTLFNAGQAAEAEPVFKKAEALDPQNPEIQYYMGSIAVSQNKIPAAIAFLEKYIAMNPQNPQNVATAKGLIGALKPAK